MSELVLLMGLPASGKTTLAKEYVSKKYKRINKDDLRCMLDNSVFTKENEKNVLEIRDGLIELFIEKGYNIVIDDTNLNAIHIKKIKAQCVKNGINFRLDCKPLLTSIEDCIARDFMRINPVGEDIIRKMDLKLMHSVFNKKEVSKCYIFDIDGTLAKQGERNIYDGSKVYLDTPIAPTVAILKELSKENDIIICTGRSEKFSQETKDWLESNGIDYARLYMRHLFDNADDMLVKTSMYRSIYNDNIEVLGVFDDRDKVVDIWRGFGLQCYQVNYGNF